MTACEMVTTTALVLGPMASRAASPTAAYVCDASAEYRKHLQSSFSLGLNGSGVLDDLYEIFEKSRQNGWDGDSAEPVSYDTYVNAKRFLESLPLGFQAPSVGVEPDGHITFEWYKAPRQILSVSISPDGYLHYASLNGLRKNFGQEPFFGELPKKILELVGAVYAE